jgi:hypothetical protein
MDSFNSLFSIASFASDPETEAETSVPVDADGGSNSYCIIA